jgi:leucyl-tRNA synthetase
MRNHYAAEDFSKKEKIYVLAEFPYPSGAGLHIGHAFTFTGSDVYARYQRMLGKNVLFPMGWDAFGLPTENYAIRTGRKPQDVTRENTDIFRKQMKELGFSFDWAREVDTTDSHYYRWTQWIFIKLFEHGLAYKQEMPINWCPSCKVGLANEEVIQGRCERCGAETTRRRIRQWVVKITDYADRLIDGLKQTEFIEKVKAAQINWIGRSEGGNIRFKIKDSADELEVFTTRPDTLWGATFMVLAPEHPLVQDLMADVHIAGYVASALKKSDLERTRLEKGKEGVFSGLMAINPGTGEQIPIWISDFVLISYGTGAIMSVPAHDERDFDFARKYGLPIVPVVMPDAPWDFEKNAYTGNDGTMQNSDFINGMRVPDAIQKTIGWLEESGNGEKAISYHLRDWIFSRQHYWGEPIPMVNCKRCGWIPVPEDKLPVILPDVENYQPTDTGESPLANIVDWVETTCPQCSGPARRETDRMPNWAGSDWYFLRFIDPHNEIALSDMEKLRYWMPVDVYVGGDEHNTLHLLYSRFIYQFLNDIGVVPQEIPEPYIKRLSHGVILGPDNARMSKSRGNVIVPDTYIEQYGADVLRTYLMFIGPFDATMAWNERAFLGVKRFLDRFTRFIEANRGKHKTTDRVTSAVINRLSKIIAEDIVAFKFNTAVAKLMEALNRLHESTTAVSDEHLQVFTRIVAPFAPFLAQEIWHKLYGEGSVHHTTWPQYDPTLELKEKIEISVQVNGKLRGLLQVDAQEKEEDVKKEAAAMEGVAKYLSRGEVVKVVYVEGRTVNFVVR